MLRAVQRIVLSAHGTAAICSHFDLDLRRERAK